MVSVTVFYGGLRKRWSFTSAQALIRADECTSYPNCQRHPRLYRNRKVPFSPQVAKAMFTQGVLGDMAGCTRVLVSSCHMQLLHHADRILVMAKFNFESEDRCKGTVLGLG